MADHRWTGRVLKKRVMELLRSHDLNQGIERLLELPARRVVNPLFSFVLSSDPEIHWPAVTAMGAVVAQMADEDMEAARVTMRRFIWQLNDESGGIGWGCPESMGEAMARHEGLAREFSPLLVSYIDEAGNFLEYEPLRKGAVWGIGRLAQARPQMVREACSHLSRFLKTSDPALRALALWALGWLRVPEIRSKIEGLAEDPGEAEVFEAGHLRKVRIKDLVQEALSR